VAKKVGGRGEVSAGGKLSVEYATVSNMREIAAIAEWSQGYPPPPPRYFLQVIHPSPRAVFFSQSGRSQAEARGGVIMTDLRALVGACFLLAVMGFVVFVPLGWWAIALGISEASPEKIIKGQPYQRKDELMQKQILPRATYEGIKYKIVAEQK
jgi:hypothetical protein